MFTRYKIITIFFFGFLLGSVNAEPFAQEKLDFGKHLMEEGDYFRAISVFKEILFHTPDRDVAQFCLREIARAYYRSNRYHASVRYLSILLNRDDITTEYTGRAYLDLAKNYYALRVVPSAESYLQRAADHASSGSVMFLRGALEAEKGNWLRSSELYDQVANSSPDSKIGPIARDLSAHVRRGDEFPKKSPFLGSIFSAVVPGAGQLYAGHVFDALQAFAYVAVFGFSTYLAYEHDRDEDNAYITTIVAGSITGLFHLGNILGAHRTVRYRNARDWNHFLKPVREAALDMDY